MQVELSTTDGHTVSDSFHRDREAGDVSAQCGRFTIFAIPKPFVGDAKQIQLNALRSWKQLQPQTDVLLLGDEPGIAEVAEEEGVGHATGLRQNQSGTPLLDSAFAIANRKSKAGLLVYCNADVILLEDFGRAVARLDKLISGPFMGFGRRTDLRIKEPVEFSCPEQLQHLKQSVKQRGRLESIVCKEYFVFRRDTVLEIPAFAVGRGNWDNWMIRSAKTRAMPVVDLSEVVTAIHQSHDYSHVGFSRWRSYVSGDEARTNQRLAGGRHLISGSTATWKMDEQGIRPVPMSGLNLAFWKDSYRFLRLMKELMFR